MEEIKLNIRNTVAIIVSAVMLVGVLAFAGFATYKALDDSDDRVAALEQQNSELIGRLEQIDNRIGSCTDAVETYHSETDAQLEKLNTEIDTINEEVEELMIDKEANEENLLQEAKPEQKDGIPTSVPQPDSKVKSAYEAPTSVPEPEPVYEEPEYEPEPEPEIVEDVGEPTGLSYYGTMELTAYIATGNPCADGVYPSTGYTAACNDPNLWHKTVYIEGYGTYYIHDTGAMSSSVIDLFVGSYDEAIQFGRRSANVYIVE